MRIRSLLLGIMAAAMLSFAAPPVFADGIMIAGAAADASTYDQSFVDSLSGIGDYTLVNPAGSTKMHGSGYLDLTNVGLDGYNLVAMNDSITDDAWLSIGIKLYGATGKYLLNDEVGLGVPLGHDVIQMIPAAALDLAMVKEDACAAPGDGSGGVLDTKSTFEGGSPGAVLGHVMTFGALGWSGSSAISAVGNTCNEQLPGLQIG